MSSSPLYGRENRMTRGAGLRATAQLVGRRRPVRGSRPVVQQWWDGRRTPVRQHALQHPNVRPKERCLMPGALRLQLRPVPRGPQRREVPAKAGDREGGTRVPTCTQITGAVHSTRVTRMLCVQVQCVECVLARTCVPQACHAGCSLPTGSEDRILDHPLETSARPQPGLRPPGAPPLQGCQ